MDFNKILERLKEPSSFAGLTGIVLGAGELFKINEAPAIAEVLGDVATGVAVSPIAGILALIAGVFAIFRGEKGNS